MNTHQILNDIPQAAKYSVLSSLISSVNCSLIGSASNIVQSIMRDGYDVREIDVREVEQLLTAPDDAEGRVSRLESPRGLYRMREYLVTLLQDEIYLIEQKDKLLGIKRDNPLRSGDLNESIKFMTTPAGYRANQTFDRLALASGISPEELKASHKEAEVQHGIDAARSAQQISENAIGIEWVIDHVFSFGAHDPVTGNEVTGEVEDVKPTVEDLPNRAQATLLDKLRNAVGKTKTKAFLSMQQGRTIYEFGDIFMLSRIMKTCDERINQLAASE
jgi:hypothetical protein